MAEPQAARASDRPPDEPGWDDRWREAALEAEYETGRREETEQKARRNVFFRIGIIVVGSVVALGGLVMLILPGPGIVALIAGLGILAQEVRWAERLMDKLKAKTRVDQVKHQPVWVRVLVGVVTVAAVALSGYFLWYHAN